MLRNTDCNKGNTRPHCAEGLMHPCYIKQWRGIGQSSRMSNPFQIYPSATKSIIRDLCRSHSPRTHCLVVLHFRTSFPHAEMHWCTEPDHSLYQCCISLNRHCLTSKSLSKVWLFFLNSQPHGLKREQQNLSPRVKLSSSADLVKGLQKYTNKKKRWKY